jgi:hypothetical protein
VRGWHGTFIIPAYIFGFCRNAEPELIEAEKTAVFVR